MAILACTHSNQTNQLRYAKDPFNNRDLRSEGIQALLQLVALLLHKQASRQVDRQTSRVQSGSEPKRCTDRLHRWLH